MSCRRRKRRFQGLTPKQVAYRHFLQSAYWKQLSADAKSRANHHCQQCGDTDRLEAHHTFYPVNWFDTRLEHLQVLCEGCHRAKHPEKQHRKRRKKPILSSQSISEKMLKAENRAYAKGRLKRTGGIRPIKYIPKEASFKPHKQPAPRLVYSVKDQQFLEVTDVWSVKLPTLATKSCPGMVNRPGRSSIER